MQIPKKVNNLSEVLGSLPGIGARSALKLAIYLSLKNKLVANNLVKALSETIETTGECMRCGNISEGDVCEICKDVNRDKQQVLVLENVLDLFQIEQSNSYNGTYVVLGGLISPINGTTVEKLGIEKLLNICKAEQPKEIILGLPGSVEGEATVLYLKRELQKINPEILITRLARGIPAIASLEFIDSNTLMDAVLQRAAL